MEQGREAGLDSLSNDDEDIRATLLLDKTASEAEPRISSSSVGGLVSSDRLRTCLHELSYGGSPDQAP